MSSDLNLKLRPKDTLGRGLSKNDFSDDAKTKVDKVELRGQEIPIQIPAEMGINAAEYPFTFSLIESRNGINFGKASLSSEAIFLRYSIALSNPGATYYVSTTGVDTNNGLTPSTAFRNIWKAIQVANTGGLPTKIIVAAGKYPRNAGFSFNFSVTPSVDLAILASGGRVDTGSFDEYANPTIDTTYTNCYSMALTNIDRVIDMYDYDQFGNYKDLIKVTTATECNNTPNSFAHVSGATVYINRKDKKAVTPLTTRILRSSTTGILLSYNCNMFIGGVTDADGFDVMGGGANGSLSGAFTSVPATKKCVVAKNSSFSYAGGWTQKDARGVGIDGMHGLAFFENCDASANVTDGFNFHNLANILTAKFLAVTLNCTGSNNGVLMLNSSCNSWTLHENLIGIDIAGYYQGSHGGTCRSVNATKNLFAGTFVKNDLGDIQGGGFMKPTAFRCDDDSIFWLERCSVDMPAGTQGLVTSFNGKIYTRNMIPSRIPNIGTILSY